MQLRPEISFETGPVWDLGSIVLVVYRNPVRLVIYEFSTHKHRRL